ncbi:hypothetical protein GTW63_16715, partial [Streptomyces sp. SID6137]|nr:hypothetical protein [Streptomyces sp. SID6137]
MREAGRSRRRSRAVVLSALAAVLLIGGGGAYVAASDGPDGRTAPTAADSTTPPPLTLDDGSDPYGAHYVAQGALPRGPGSAAVYGAGAEVRADQVLRLA